MIRKLLITLAVLAFPFAAQAQLYPLFGPSNGIMKGAVGTPQTTSAVSTDVTGLFCGTSTTNFLRADGTCAVPAGAAPSGAQNLVYATPNGSTGSASLRALVGADLPPINLGSAANGGVLSTSILLGTNGGTSNGFFSVAGPATTLRTFTFPNASATVLTSNAAVTVPQGGTGLATLTANSVVLGEGTLSPNFVTMGADTVLRGTASADPVATNVPNCGSTTTALNYSTSTHTFGCQTLSSGGTPGGSPSSIQFNNAGVFGGTSDVSYSSGTMTFAATGTTVPNTIWDSTGSAWNQAWFAPTQQQFVYTILGAPNVAGSPKNGPGIQARWDGGTANRYIAFGTFDGSGTWAPTLTLLNGTAFSGAQFQASANSGTNTTIFTATGTAGGLYLASCNAPGGQAVSSLFTVNSAGTGLSQTTWITGGTVALSASGLNIQCTQTVSGSVVISGAVTRLNF